MSKEMSKETTKIKKAVYTCQKSPVVAQSLFGPAQLISTAGYVAQPDMSKEMEKRPIHM